MGTWIDQTYIERLAGQSVVVGATDDSADPSSVDSDVLDQFIAQAESRVAGRLRPLYPTDVDAGTASPTVAYMCGVLCLASLAQTRRIGPGAMWNGEAQDVEELLDRIVRGDAEIPEWTADTEIEQDKLEFQADGDLYETHLDQPLVPNEHDGDVR